MTIRKKTFIDVDKPVAYELYREGLGWTSIRVHRKKEGGCHIQYGDLRRAKTRCICPMRKITREINESRKKNYKRL